MSKSIILVELNYQVTPLQVRERISSQHDTIEQQLLARTKDNAFIISTCHRYSILTFSESEQPAIDVLQQACPILLREQALILSGQEAVRHLFATACGLHSRTVGEHEILGQIRNALRSSKKIGSELNELIKRAIYTGKRARTETCIGRYSTSLTAITGERIKQHFPETTNLSVLLFGTGEMARLVAQRLRQLRVGRIDVVSKDMSRAKTFCEASNMRAMAADDALAGLDQYQVIIGATWTREFLVQTVDTVSEEKLLIDLGMPRNIDPALAKRDHVHLYDLDNINEEVNSAIERRHHEVTSVHGIIIEEMKEFASWLGFRQFVPEIIALKTQLAALRGGYEEGVKARADLTQKEQSSLIHEIRGLVQSHFSQIISVLRADLDDQLRSTYRAQIFHSLEASLHTAMKPDQRVVEV